MGLICEYAITPSVFSTAVNTIDSKHNFRRLKEILLESGVVRDLHDGHWYQLFAGDQYVWDADRIKFLSNLKRQNRLRTFTSVAAATPSDDVEWCREALASHNADQLKGVISIEQTCRNIRQPNLVTSIEKMHCCSWIPSIECSIHLNMKAQDYMDALKLIIQCSNSIMFIDPYLNPIDSGYDVFNHLFVEAGKRIVKPQIEIHTSCKAEAHISDQAILGDLEKNYRDSWSDLVKQNGLEIDVYKWPNFHDRYIITDLVGLSLPFGFKSTTASNDKTIWTRLQRRDRDIIQTQYSKTNRPRSFKIL